MLYFLHNVMIYQYFTLIVKYFIHVSKGRPFIINECSELNYIS